VNSLEGYPSLGQFLSVLENLLEGEFFTFKLQIVIEAPSERLVFLQNKEAVRGFSVGDQKYSDAYVSMFVFRVKKEYMMCSFEEH
jgi:hypothetical protein